MIKYQSRMITEMLLSKSVNMKEKGGAVMPAMGGFSGSSSNSVNSNAGGAKWITYTIQSGDTLTDIGRRYNVSVNDLVSWNNIKNPDLIYAGDTLKIKQ